VNRLIFTIVLLTVALTSWAQFRPTLGMQSEEKPASMIDAMRGSGESFFSSLFSPERFRMNQTYSVSFMTGGGQSVSMSSFTNTFSYKAGDDVFIAADLTALYSPYSSFGRDHAKSLSGIYLSNARLDWKLSESSFIRISYSRLPYASSLVDPYFW
jgi:hypothetical protein